MKPRDGTEGEHSALVRPLPQMRFGITGYLHHDKRTVKDNKPTRLA